MVYKVRLLETGFQRAAFNMGLDEALLRAVAEGTSLPTLRFYGWKPAAVSLGYFQGLQEEIDMEACKKAGIDVVRRITGGGAVFHSHEATYSIALPLDHPLACQNILESYRLLLHGITEGLATLGIQAAFAPINDIIADGKKISGNAQTRKLGCILQHGTIILDVDVDQMFTVLRVPKEKSKGKLIEDIKARVTSVRSCVPSMADATFDTLYSTTVEALKKGFARALDLELISSAPSNAEVRLANELAENKFSSMSWTAMR